MATSPGYSFAAALIRVIDGDTMVFDIDLGFRILQTHSIRLEGLNCPEIHTPEGRDATAYADNWFTTNGPSVVLFTQQNPFDKYGRYLAKVVSPTGSCLNTDLLATGHAVVWDGKGPKP